MSNAVTVYIGKDVALPDRAGWTNRFEIPSATSDRIYVIAQHKTKRHWGCSCPAYRTRRYCTHLKSLGLPTNERPYEPVIESGK
jgi:hypothetical protein